MEELQEIQMQYEAMTQVDTRALTPDQKKQHQQACAALLEQKRTLTNQERSRHALPILD
jgi:hypothetical protein